MRLGEQGRSAEDGNQLSLDTWLRMGSLGSFDPGDELLETKRSSVSEIIKSEKILYIYTEEPLDWSTVASVAYEIGGCASHMRSVARLIAYFNWPFIQKYLISQLFLKI